MLLSYGAGNPESTGLRTWEEEGIVDDVATFLWEGFSIFRTTPRVKWVTPPYQTWKGLMALPLPIMTACYILALSRNRAYRLFSFADRAGACPMQRPNATGNRGWEAVPEE
ncbi:hypothetical protein AGABI1DRAFT_135184 [Agaricus bisporus var. burnettii JB137-S8]|uniref:Uncharacterized protein n=1 Tax=Agaricus bisporus var. burnettii (strain JB137-S8 / ATCC MYA-4627 / FGSC 10392) TaxID=597362 RepID=K5WR96_AGABU|nr:uncharacterized protein AGABI1DRAFT_135184 [Agaricus bisporus var. burnettii JB137-S8]EKM73273.1 hypothetical protein AGABI1DRAFT_135184 [Agaricus bisporus var. burnettii JB137-S8]